MRAYRLKFLSPFHLDSGDAVDGPSELFIKSDTLFSAICSAAYKFYGNKIVSDFLTQGALVVSSAFPFYKDELFFPKPYNFNLKKSYSELFKEFKKIRFIEKEHLIKLLNGEMIEDHFFNKDYFLNGCWRTKPNNTGGKADKIFKISENPHIILDRISNATKIFYKTEVYFTIESGLFFIVNVSNELLSKLETIIRFLGDEGIGADRTSGKGFFEIKEIEDFHFPKIKNTDHHYLLSLYSPGKTELNSILPYESNYKIEIRKGWVSNKSLRRKSIRMFGEGSVIKMNTDISPKGIIHTVLEKSNFQKELHNDIFRNGQVISFPIAGGGNGTA